MTTKAKEILVTTGWVSEHASDPKVRIVEVDVDTAAYDQGHVENAVGWNWQSQLCDTVRRDIIPKAQLEKLLSDSGIGNDTTIVLYGDNNNWFACWAYWQLKMFGHKGLRVMDGGRKKWVAENRPLTTAAPKFAHASYRAKEYDQSLRAFLPDVQAAVAARKAVLVDVRSPDEYSGKILSPPGLPETCQRGGHVPGAFSVPWGKNCNDDGTFKSHEELAKLYEPSGALKAKEAIAYCRIGERSSLTWFVLHELLGHENVKNYDGSWTEWGNLVNAPVAKGEKPEGA
jgi:thiosulfate/3-mercaptopyruvate sulfurtransferase